MTLDENDMEPQVKNILNFEIISTKETLQVKLNDKEVFFGKE